MVVAAAVALKTAHWSDTQFTQIASHNSLKQKIVKQLKINFI